MHNDSAEHLTFPAHIAMTITHNAIQLTGVEHM